jgi:hypothetical protein
LWLVQRHLRVGGGGRGGRGAFWSGGWLESPSWEWRALTLVASDLVVAGADAPLGAASQRKARRL